MFMTEQTKTDRTLIYWDINLKFEHNLFRFTGFDFLPALEKKNMFWKIYISYKILKWCFCAFFHSNKLKLLFIFLNQSIQDLWV